MGWNYFTIHKLEQCNRWSLLISFHTLLVIWLLSIQRLILIYIDTWFDEYLTIIVWIFDMNALSFAGNFGVVYKGVLRRGGEVTDVAVKTIKSESFNTLRPRRMDAISQTTFPSTFSWMKMVEFRLKVHWSLFLRVELTIFQHWFR